MKRISALILLILSIKTYAVNGSMRPVNNAFVLNPGIASPLPDANDLNFGGSGSLCVSSELARAYDPLFGINQQPKGEFTTLLKFDSGICIDTTIDEISLKLAITNGNQSANKIFNFLGNAGNFDLYWIVNDWEQGYGTSKTPAGPDAGITYTTLSDLLDQSTYVYLETFYYDAPYSYYEGENWFEYILDLNDSNYSGLLEALEDGQTITLMLHASPESEVCFNIRAYVQYNALGVASYRQNGPYLDVQATLPFTDIDFDDNQEIGLGDLPYMTDYWLQTGENLLADIAPLGGDGIVNMLDFAEFAKHWKQTPSSKDTE